MLLTLSPMYAVLLVGTSRCILYAENELEPHDEDEDIDVQGRNYNWKKLDDALPNSDKQLFEEAKQWFVLNRLGLLRKVTHQGDVQGRFRYAKDIDGVWYRFIHPPLEFEHYVDSLPQISRRCDNSRLRLSEDGKTWTVERSYDGKVSDLKFKGAKQSMQGGQVVRNARDELGSWYTFINPPDDALRFIDALPTIDINYQHSDNYRLFPISEGEEWRIKDDKGVFRKLVVKGDALYNEKSIYYVRADDHRWYKFRRPPQRFVKYLESFPEQKHTIKKPPYMGFINDGKLTKIG